MNLKEILTEYYQILATEKFCLDTGYSRESISSQSGKLLDLIDKKSQAGIEIDDKIFSFLNFLKGYDTSGYEDDEYLFDTLDLEREFKLLGDINTLDGIYTDIDEW